MNKDMVASAVSSALSASAPIAGPGGLIIAGWNWLAGHDIAWFVGVSSLILIWLQIREKIFLRRGQR
ncbi:hypothetical protein UA17_01775 [Burkholderia multivorans]|uniref:hypothetical protein n=1 Tax=Burkholderia multivorans TaxID=87883 RepID=UPI0009E0CCE2|nr:hypothetical protein [Burkholderia multivorans]MBU9668853.1 hypothetical protein [Burkholderia multivorans]SAK19264.1 hypothetical protein UA17_01775 [Burkholderia multivorans]HEF4751907.1 hypothetical protein [Burkholderia multivorans]